MKLAVGVLALAACSLNVDYQPGTDAPAPATCATAISAGVNHACAIRADGTAWCWGQNAAGQLGDNTTEDRSEPVAVVATGLPKLTAISGGFQYTCAIGVDHSVWCWGANGDGQLGNRTTSDNHVPVKVADIANATAVVTGAHHTCVIDGGVVKCWGNNFFGQLGNGSTGASSSPVSVTLAGNATVSQLAAANGETCALDSTGGVQCWGANDSGQLGNGVFASNDPATSMPVSMQLPADSKAVSIAVGADFACAALSDGTVFCTGHNNVNQLGPHPAGVDPNSDFSNTPRQIPLGVTAKSVLAGDRFACAIDDHGKLWCWGGDDNFELASGGDPRDQAYPVQVDYPDAKLASGGAGFLCVQSSDGLRCGGYDGFGQLGDGHRTTTPTPIAVDAVNGATAVTTGASFTCAVLADTSVMCWGQNDRGQLGDGTFASRTQPVQVIGLHDVKKLVSAHRHSCALLADQTVACWGDNNSGQLGDGSWTTRAVPRAVLAGDKATTPLAGVIDIAVGDSHTCAVVQGGTVKCWGNNFEGQLGSGVPGSNDRTVPTDLVLAASPTGPAGVTHIAAGVDHTCVIDNAGKLWCWGANELGQLGIDRPDDARMIPRQTITPRQSVFADTSLTFDQVSSFTDFTCAHATNNDVWCWGYNNDGELGRDNVSFFEALPAKVNGLQATQIAVGEMHGCAIGPEGGVMCWGADYLGQIGQAEYNAYGTRQTVSGLANAKAIAGGANHSCALLAGGALMCWGDNRDGELGNGIRLSEVPVVPLLACP